MTEAGPRAPHPTPRAARKAHPARSAQGGTASLPFGPAYPWRRDPIPHRPGIDRLSDRGCIRCSRRCTNCQCGGSSRRASGFSAHEGLRGGPRETCGSPCRLYAPLRRVVWPRQRSARRSSDCRLCRRLPETRAPPPRLQGAFRATGHDCGPAKSERGRRPRRPPRVGGTRGDALQCEPKANATTGTRTTVSGPLMRPSHHALALVWKRLLWS